MKPILTLKDYIDSIAENEEQEIHSLEELVINTAAGKKKVIHKVPLTTIDGRKIMAYPDSAGNGSNGD